MRKALIPLLLCAVLLWGCAAQNPEPAETASAAPVTLPAAEPIQEALCLNLLEKDGAVHRFGLSDDVSGFLPLGENLLFFSGKDTTTLTLVDPEEQKALAVYETGMILTAQNATVQPLGSGISFFNGSVRETVVLDNTLREVRRIAAPEDMTGMPLLSKDSSSLYYCTPSAIRALDLDTGISRVLKEAAYPVQSVSGLLLDDSVLQISITETDGTWRTLFLSTENGQLLHSREGNVLPHTSADHYFLDEQSTILCGSATGSAMVLEPRLQDADCRYLPGSNRAVCFGLKEDTTVLERYDLNSGRRTAELALPGFLFPEHLSETPDGTVWFLIPGENGQLLCRWDPAASAVQDDTLYIHPYYTREAPDYDGLAACALHAQEIGEKYGIEVLVYKDAVATEPWDYHLEYEYQATILRRELKALDERLERFPEGFLQTLRSKFTALKICLVRSAEGSPESGSPEAVNGIQFMDGFDAYIVLASDHDTEYALYHELSHLMETVVLTESTAYDRWDNLNPQGFSYDNNYLSNSHRDGNQWLQPGRESFIDTYSMSYPKEDRARLFEYAMTDHHEELFRSPNLQLKLRQMCTGIREAFGLKQFDGALPWEQYLTEN